MYTTYHFNSASEVNTDILEAIKIAFKGKAIVITVAEENEPAFEVPDGQKELVLSRQQYYKEHPEELLDWEEARKNIRFNP